MTEHTALSPLARLVQAVSNGFGLILSGGLSRSQRIAFDELMNLTDRQLEDIGLTRSLIRTVVLQGPQSARPVFPEGAVQTPANVNSALRTSGAA